MYSDADNISLHPFEKTLRLRQDLDTMVGTKFLTATQEAAWRVCIIQGHDRKIAVLLAVLGRHVPPRPLFLLSF